MTAIRLGVSLLLRPRGPVVKGAIPVRRTARMGEALMFGIPAFSRYIFGMWRVGVAGRPAQLSRFRADIRGAGSVPGEAR